MPDPYRTGAPLVQIPNKLEAALGGKKLQIEHAFGRGECGCATVCLGPAVNNVMCRAHTSSQPTACGHTVCT